jgi:hypothetical protein
MNQQQRSGVGGAGAQRITDDPSLRLREGSRLIAEGEVA